MTPRMKRVVKTAVLVNLIEQKKLLTLALRQILLSAVKIGVDQFQDVSVVQE